MYKKWFLTITVLFLAASLSLTNPVFASSEMWSQTYGGLESDVAYSLIETSDGGYALAGYMNYFGGFWVVKTDRYGNMEWNKTYGGTAAYSLIETSDGGYAIAGYTYSLDTDSSDFLLVKTNEYGNIEWNKTYGGTDSDRAYSLIETTDGGFALVGRTLLVKTDSNGNMEWNHTYGGTNYEMFYSMVESSDGGYALAGGIGDADFWLVKTDNYGNVEWSKTYDGGATHEFAYSLIETTDGGYALAGITVEKMSPVYTIWLVKTDAEGNMLWNQTCGGGGGGFEYSLIETSDGGFAIAGHIQLVKTDCDGNTLWMQTYGKLPDDRIYLLTETTDGGYALAGTTSSTGAGADDFWLIKTDEYGIIPEFPSGTIMPLLLIALFVAILCKQQLTKKTTNISIN